jgi:hypothetical protein
MNYASKSVQNRTRTIVESCSTETETPTGKDQSPSIAIFVFSTDSGRRQECVHADRRASHRPQTPPSALIGRVAGYAGHALALSSILAVFVVLVHAKPLLAQVVVALSVPLSRQLLVSRSLSELDCSRTFGMLTLLTCTQSRRADSADTSLPFWRSVRAGDDPRNVTRAGERV